MSFLDASACIYFMTSLLYQERSAVHKSCTELVFLLSCTSELFLHSGKILNARISMVAPTCPSTWEAEAGGS